MQKFLFQNNHAIGLMWWLLAREVLLLRGKISRTTGFVVDEKVIMPDLYFYRDPQEQEKETAEAETEAPKESAWATYGVEGAAPEMGGQVCAKLINKNSKFSKNQATTMDLN